MNIRHAVAVFSQVKGSGKRQKKGTEKRTIYRTITLLDVARHYMYAKSGDKRTLSAIDTMRFNPSSLIGIYLLDLGIRDIIEGVRPDALEKGHGVTKDHDSIKLFGDNVIADCKELFESLIPNCHLKGRALYRCVWGVSRGIFDAHNKAN